MDEQVIKDLQEMSREMQRPSSTPIGARLRRWLKIDKWTEGAEVPAASGAEAPAASGPSTQAKSPEYFISTLRLCGGIYFVASIIAGALCVLGSLGGTGWFIGVGAGLIFQGYVFYALLNVVGLVLENLIAIRESLSGENKRSSATVSADGDPSV